LINDDIRQNYGKMVDMLAQGDSGIAGPEAIEDYGRRQSGKKKGDGYGDEGNESERCSLGQCA
jgi:hypothetical protein